MGFEPQSNTNVTKHIQGCDHFALPQHSLVKKSVNHACKLDVIGDGANPGLGMGLLLYKALGMLRATVAFGVSCCAEKRIEPQSCAYCQDTARAAVVPITAVPRKVEAVFVYGLEGRLLRLKRLKQRVQEMVSISNRPRSHVQSGTIA